MPERFVESFVEKLILLEQRTGVDVHYRVMPPLTVRFHDSIEIQRVAKKIAEFVGLTGFTFIIGIAKQKKNVAGHIELSTASKEVFVEVDSGMMEFPDAVAATLCHEVCHKWLHVNGIRASTESDNEILTDITSVFLGFGKIMLNGCRTTSTTYEETPDGTRTRTNSMTAGYLDRDQLAFVYRLVAAMRRISARDFMQGLSDEAALAVQNCDSLYGHHYDLALHRMEGAELTTALDSHIVEVQRAMADLHKHVTYIRKSFCDPAEESLNGSHRKLESLRKRAMAMAPDTEPDPALRFLLAMQAQSGVRRLGDDVDSIARETSELLQHARPIGRHLSRRSPLSAGPSSAMFNIVTCPQDGTKLKLPENSGNIIAACPKCKYRFAYSTNALSFPEEAAPPRLTWWEKVRSLVSRSRTD
jgi:hypothetical protein